MSESNELACPSCGFHFVPINPPYKDTQGRLITYCPHCLMYFEVEDEK